MEISSANHVGRLSGIYAKPSKKWLYLIVASEVERLQIQHFGFCSYLENFSKEFKILVIYTATKPSSNKLAHTAHTINLIK